MKLVQGSKLAPRFAVVGVALLGAALAMAPAHAEAPAAAGVFAMPQQDLDSALRALASQADLQLLYAAEVTNGRVAPAVHARSPREALEQLLAGSGLRVLWNGPRSATIAAPVSAALISPSAPAYRPGRLDVSAPAPIIGRGAAIGYADRLAREAKQRIELGSPAGVARVSAVMGLSVAESGEVTLGGFRAEGAEREALEGTVRAALANWRTAPPPPGLTFPIVLRLYIN